MPLDHDINPCSSCTSAISGDSGCEGVPRNYITTLLVKSVPYQKALGVKVSMHICRGKSIVRDEFSSDTDDRLPNVGCWEHVVSVVFLSKRP